jgi:GMP synthase (glutamine-hydrolysing)
MADREHVLVVENEDGAGPEMFQQWLAAAGVAVELCRPYAGEPVPARLEHGGVMVLGGEMGACEDDRAPWLVPVRQLLAEATHNGLPVLGICLGAQMLATACGGRVEASRSGGELGLGQIELTDKAGGDRLFAGIASPAEVVQWHNDEITELPDGAIVLASSAACRVQAFRVGVRAWGVQFHPEVTSAVLRGWADAGGQMTSGRRRRLDSVIAEVAVAESRLFSCWQGLAERFAAVVKQP